jgi:hypothetical protein
MVKSVYGFVRHGFFHWLFVTGVSLIQDMSALSVGGLVLLIAFFIFSTSYSDLIKMTLGIPVLVIGSAIAVINLYGLSRAIISHSYSHKRCPFCENPIQIVDSEVKITCHKCRREIDVAKLK